LALAFLARYFIGSVFIGDTNRTIALRGFDIIAFQAMIAEGTKRACSPLDGCNISWRSLSNGPLFRAYLFREAPIYSFAELLMSPDSRLMQGKCNFVFCNI
jgi:hypothetical protein